MLIERKHQVVLYRFPTTASVKDVWITAPDYHLWKSDGRSARCDRFQTHKLLDETEIWQSWRSKCKLTLSTRLVHTANTRYIMWGGSTFVLHLIQNWLAAGCSFSSDSHTLSFGWLSCQYFSTDPPTHTHRKRELLLTSNTTIAPNVEVSLWDGWWNHLVLPRGGWRNKRTHEGDSLCKK